MVRRLEPADVGVGRLFWLINDAVVVGDPASGVIELWNPGAERIFGYSADEAVGMPIVTLVAPEVRDRHLAGLERYRATATMSLAAATDTLELPAVHRDGHRLWVSLTLAELTTGDGALVIACMRDITDRHAAEQAVAEANRSLRQFIAVVAHDLRGPLTTLNASLDMLDVQRAELTDDVGRFVEIAARHGHGVLQLVNQLLDVAQLDAGTVLADPQRVVVADAVGDAIDMSGASGVAVNVAAGANEVVADRGHVRRILANLLTNAVQHGAAPITVSAIDEGIAVAIRVTDAGVGVSLDLIPLLFEPLSRTGGAGTGLGLAIARRLARLNGGDVTYTDRDGHGGSFTLTLPRAA